MEGVQNIATERNRQRALNQSIFDARKKNAAETSERTPDAAAADSARSMRLNMAAMQAQNAMSEMAAAAGRNKNKEAKEELAWKMVWKGIMSGLKALFTSTTPSIIAPIFIGPIIAFLYLLRLFGANLLHKGRPWRVPLIGAIEFQVSPLSFPVEVVMALVWIFVTFLVSLAVIAFLLYFVWTGVQIIETLKELCPFDSCENFFA